MLGKLSNFTKEKYERETKNLTGPSYTPNVPLPGMGMRDGDNKINRVPVVDISSLTN